MRVKTKFCSAQTSKSGNSGRLNARLDGELLKGVDFQIRGVVCDGEWMNSVGCVV